MLNMKLYHITLSDSELDYYSLISSKDINGYELHNINFFGYDWHNGIVIVNIDSDIIHSESVSKFVTIIRRDLNLNELLCM